MPWSPSFCHQPVSTGSELLTLNYSTKVMGKKKHPPRPDPSTLPNQTKMRCMERDFKARRDTPYDIVLDVNDEDERIALLPSDVVADPREMCKLFGTPSGECRAYQFTQIEGFYLMPNLFSPRAQRDLVRRCLKAYTRRPNVSNLDTHYVLPNDAPDADDSGLWRMYKAQVAGLDTDKVVELRHGQLSLHNGYDVDPAETEVKHLQPLAATQLIHRIRWFSLGYHYNWSTKSYHLDRPVPMPSEVRDISRAVAKALEKPMGINGDLYEPEAGIVNHYSFRDTLMAHQDRSELDETSPLVSISLGSTAVFIMGYPTNDLDSPSPTPMWLRSGDVSVMSGPCRRNFHGVPRIVEDTLPEFLSTRAVLDANEDPEEWKPFGQYMESGKRLNINVRQVFPAQKPQRNDGSDMSIHDL